MARISLSGSRYLGVAGLFDAAFAVCVLLDGLRLLPFARLGMTVAGVCLQLFAIVVLAVGCLAKRRNPEAWRQLLLTLGVLVALTALGIAYTVARLSELGQYGFPASAWLAVILVVVGAAVTVSMAKRAPAVASAGGTIFWACQFHVLWLNITHHWYGLPGCFTQLGGFVRG
jgi:hypothetical protein